MRGQRRTAAGRDEDLAEVRQVELGTALVLGVLVLVASSVGLWLLPLLLELAGLTGPRWGQALEISAYGVVVLSGLATLGWLVRARRREPPAS